MSDTPKFEVIDRRKMKAEEEKDSAQRAPQEPAKAAPTERSTETSPGPRLVVNELMREEAMSREEAKAREEVKAPATTSEEPGLMDGMPPPPTAKESHEQKAAYDASTQRLEDLIRAQNPAVGPQPPMGFEHLVQQFYVTAMLQMGAGSAGGPAPQSGHPGRAQPPSICWRFWRRRRGAT